MGNVFLRRATVLGLGLLGLGELGACHSEPPVTGKTAAPVAPASPLEARVLARHDSLMILTDRLFAVRQRLTARRAELPADSANLLGTRLDSAVRATLRADDAMMDWMHAYRRPAPDTPPDSATTYLTRQLRALTVIDLLTHRALDSAAAVLQPAPPAAPITP